MDASSSPMEPQSDLTAIKRFLSSRICTAEYDAPGDGASCMTRLNSVTFGAVCVVSHTGMGCRRGLRRMDHIRADHVDDFLISLPVRGRSVFSQSGMEMQLDPGHFAVLTTSKPFSISIASENDQSEFLQYTAIVSGPMLRSRVHRIDEYCDKTIRIAPGAGTIMASLFDLAVREGKALSQAQSRVFGGMLVDAVANSTREAPELSGLRVESRQHSYVRIREQAEYFIASNISDPTLGPRQVAGHCKISARYLNEVFAAASMTVVSFIRETRLKRCREALLTHELCDRSIFEIALRWGFNDPAHFSRVYKARFGKAPREDRRLN